MKITMLFLVTLFLLGLAPGLRAGTPDQVRIYTPEEVADFCYVRNGITYLAFPGARRWALEGSPADFCAMQVDEVAEAVEAVEFPLEKVRIRILILPLPRRDLPKSSAEGSVIFLSPGRILHHTEHIHYTVAHEIGHVIHNTLMPDGRDDLWREYSSLRGLTYSADADAPHSRRLHEVFAEDFRVLFGGEIARCGGEVENHEIQSPFEVAGLRDFMLSLAGEYSERLMLTSYPNPFETGVVIRASAAGQEAGLDEVVVFEVTGRVVRTIVPPWPGCQEVVWDGRGAEGRPVAPGIYMVLARSGGRAHICKMVKAVR
jgi:hypothetical protein